mgnify:CR=1 FL=1|jgi:hypothetical protein
MSDGSGSIATLGSIRGMPNLLDDVERMPERPSVPSLIALLRSTDETERDDALASLAELVDGAFGVDGAELGLAVRANGGIALLSWLLADPSAEVQQMALMILGNLCSDSVDSNSRATKALLLQSGGARALLSCVHTEDPAVLLFACGALQNLCFEPDWSELAVAHDIHIRLQGLLCHEDAMIVRYASGCLQNITRSLHIDGLSELAVEAVKERNLEHRREGWLEQRARMRIARALLDIPSEVRLTLTLTRTLSLSLSLRALIDIPSEVRTRRHAASRPDDQPCMRVLTTAPRPQVRTRRHAAGVRRRQRAANLGDSDSRPSSAASSRSTGSYVSARSSSSFAAPAVVSPAVPSPAVPSPAASPKWSASNW